MTQSLNYNVLNLLWDLKIIVQDLFSTWILDLVFMTHHPPDSPLDAQ